MRTAFERNQLKDLELIFAALAAATLAETYLVIRVIVNYMFAESDYSYPSDRTRVKIPA